MAIGLSRVFSKTPESVTVPVIDPKSVPIGFAREAFLRYLYPKDTSQVLTVPQKLVLNVTTHSMQKKESRQKSVPRLPYVIPKLLKSLRDPNSSAKHYVQIIDKDPAMAAAVLKLANSVYFNPIGKRIDEIETAVVKLGIDGIRSVLSAAVLQPIIQRNSAYFSNSGQKIWQHSLYCAVACELIAEHRKVEKFKVYVMGLMHDIGTITLFSELCKQFKLNHEDVAPGYNAFVPPIKAISIPLSYLIVKDWELPQDICKALAEQNNISPDKEVSIFGQILYQANMVCETYDCIYPKNPKKAIALLEELELPLTLYDSLEQLDKEL
ncbi:MAG: HD-like signal output (HDOD) protein [Flavobacteriales bacterium]|jgi:HD-like signal output (HDOD) protein